MRYIATLFVTLVTPIPIVAQENLVPGIAKGDLVVIAIPLSLIDVQRTGMFGQNFSVDFNVRRAESGVEVLDGTIVWRKDWREVGFPSLSDYQVKSIKTVRGEGKSKRLEVKLSGPGYEYRVYAPEGQGTAIAQVLFPNRYSDSLSRMAYRAIAPHVFKGPLEVFSEPDRMALLSFAHVTASGTALGTEMFKEVNYVAITLPAASETWNDLRLSLRSSVMTTTLMPSSRIRRAWARTYGSASSYCESESTRSGARFRT